MWQGLIHRYREHLPVSNDDCVITLHEGNTPLIPLDRLSRRTPGLRLWAKYEGANPTGSFKDRGMTLAVSKAVSEGARAVICASTGNTSASAAAYSARAGLRCLVLIPEGKVALGKLAQAIHYGAEIVAIDGNFDRALDIAREIADDSGITLVNSLNPYRIEGQKTAAFEVCDQLGHAPDYLAIPVGNAGNITAYWRGFSEYHRLGRVNSRPRVFGFQAEGAAPIVRGHPIERPETIATAIRIGHPASWRQAEAVRDESGGIIESVTDQEILEAYSLLASEEGVFCEPASAASVAGILKLAKSNYLTGMSSDVVCVLTGNGLKDPDTAVDQAVRAPHRVPANQAAVRRTFEEIIGP